LEARKLKVSSQIDCDKVLSTASTTKMTIDIALIGSGIFAKEEHLPAIQDTPSLSLKAVYSRSLKSAKTLSEKLSDVEIYSDDQEGKKFDDLLKRDDVKGVVIAYVFSLPGIATHANTDPDYPFSRNQTTSRRPLQPANTYSQRSQSPRTWQQLKNSSHGPRTLPTHPPPTP
jgi:hypothetical protein